MLKIIRPTLLWLAMLATPVAATAEDIDIYGSGATTVPPNILIIFDTSGSMGTADVPGESFDPARTYSGSYDSNLVYRRDCTIRVNSSSTSWWCRQTPNSPFCQPSYRRTCSDDWLEFAPGVDAIGCQSLHDALVTSGYASGKIDAASPYACSGDALEEQELRTGNYLNYTESGLGTLQRRTDVAKEVVVDLINRTEGVRFGLMRFNNNEGGSLVAPVGTDKTTLIDTVNSLPASDWTPLAETLAEAGLYFSGKNSWFNTGVTYTSPIEYPCQKNFVILITDGAPTKDDNLKLSSSPYINGDTIGDQDNDGRDPGTYADGGSDYLDDVAYYLRNRDLRPDLGDAGSQFEDQNITTYTIGFKTTQTLLQDTAFNGGGLYYSAENYSALTEAFDNIINSIQERNAIYLAPVVPVSRINGTFAGNRLYLGFFKPQASGLWRGNLKAYNLTDSGQLLDQNGMPATDANGLLIDGTQSLWSPSADGPEVDRGGVGEVLANRTTARNIYSYLGVQADLNHPTNAFAESNPQLTDIQLGVAGTAARSSIILSTRAEDSPWPMGDVIHSEPVVEHYFIDANSNGLVDAGDLKSYIFIGANDGMLHVFDDETGNEIWAFVPPGQLARLSLLNDANHDYFVDGPMALLDDGVGKTLVFGERRGGSRYYALDVTNPTAPSWKYQLTSTLLVGTDGDGNGSADGIAATLGQSWVRPQPVALKIDNAIGNYLLFAGGYDVGQDAATPPAGDSVGKAIFTVRADTGTVAGLNVNGGNWNLMSHCIIDVTGVDTHGDNLVNRIYAGDLGGNLFALRDDDHNGVWDKNLLFSLPSTLTVNGQTVNLGRKFMYKPEVSAELDGEFLYVGTGDRERPTDTQFVDAIYAIKSNWQVDGVGNYVTLTPSALVDLTDNKIQQGTNEEKIQVKTALNNGQGWFIRLTNPGEKVVASPVLFNKVLYFTTYTPGSSTLVISDPCTTSTDRGIARLYAIDYRTGASVFNFYTDPNDPDALTSEDRALVIGTSIPSGAVIAVLTGGPKVLVGVEGGIVEQQPNASSTVHQYFWHQTR